MTLLKSSWIEITNTERHNAIMRIATSDEYQMGDVFDPSDILVETDLSQIYSDTASGMITSCLSSIGEIIPTDNDALSKLGADIIKDPISGLFHAALKLIPVGDSKTLYDATFIADAVELPEIAHGSSPVALVTQPSYLTKANIPHSFN